MTYAQTGNTGLPDFRYSFNAGSNITRKTFEHRDGAPSEDYQHDTLHRLTRTSFGQRDTGSGVPYEGFTYDHLGNHLTQNDNGTTTAGLFNAINEQTKRGATDVLYDKRGNLTKDDDGQVYFYDRQNLLTRVEKPAGTLVATYSYDALGRRIEKAVNGGDTTRFYWNDWQTLEETDASADVQRHYIWGAIYIDELLLMRDVIGAGGTANADYIVCYTHNFDVVTTLDASGTVVERYDYNPHGERFVLDSDYSDDADGLSDVGINVGHRGKTHDRESGLIFNNARILHPVLGRFMQRDPLGYADGMNLLAAYHLQQQSVDPTGLQQVSLKVGFDFSGSVAFHLDASGNCDGSGTITFKNFVEGADLAKRLAGYRNAGKDFGTKTWIPVGIPLEGAKTLIGARGRGKLKSGSVHFYLERRWEHTSDCPSDCGKPVFRVKAWGDETWNATGEVRYATAMKSGKTVKWTPGKWEKANDQEVYRQSNSTGKGIDPPTDCECKKLEQGDNQWVSLLPPGNQELP